MTDRRFHELRIPVAMSCATRLELRPTPLEKVILLDLGAPRPRRAVRGQRRVRLVGTSCECMGLCVLPNVRAKLAPTVGRAGQVGENVQRTADLARVARRWCST